MANPEFTFDWISLHFQTWEDVLPKIDRPNILEVGCFEGRATFWFLNYFKDCSITCIDTFKGSAEHSGINFIDIEDRFRRNLKPWLESGKVRVMKGLSRTCLRKLNLIYDAFDIAFIDGSHASFDVLTDAVLIWPLMKKGGIVIFDDYGWGTDRPIHETPKPAIDAFMVCCAGQFEILAIGYQIILKKVGR